MRTDRCAVQLRSRLQSLLKLRPARAGFGELGKTIARVAVEGGRGLAPVPCCPSVAYLRLPAVFSRRVLSRAPHVGMTGRR